MNPAATPLEVRDVSVLYGANRVLDRVSLSVGPRSRMGSCDRASFRT